MLFIIQYLCAVIQDFGRSFGRSSVRHAVRGLHDQPSLHELDPGRSCARISLLYAIFIRKYSDGWPIFWPILDGGVGHGREIMCASRSGRSGAPHASCTLAPASPRIPTGHRRQTGARGSPGAREGNCSGHQTRSCAGLVSSLRRARHHSCL